MRESTNSMMDHMGGDIGGSIEIGYLKRRQPYFRWPNLPMFDPTKTQWLDKWDFLVLVVLLEVTFVTPVELAFMEVQLSPLFFLNRVIDLIFIADMTLKFMICIPDPNKRGCWIKDHRSIAHSYLTSWFFADLIGCAPVEIWILLVKDLSNNNLKILRLARTVRLVRVTQGLRLLHRWKTTMGLRNWLISIIGLIYTLSVCCHWAACFWSYIGRHGDEEFNWIELVRAAKGEENLYQDPVEIYWLALYWAIYTMAGIGYGDVQPASIGEYQAALFCMAVMAALYALVIAQVCAITSTFSVHEVNFKRTMDDLNWLLSDWKVKQQVRRNLRAYFMESRDLQRTQMQKGILEQMSPKLQGEVLNRLHRPWTSKVRFLKDMSDEALVMIVQKLQAQLFAPDELVLGDRTLFIVRRGVAVLTGKVMVSGTSWGEDLVLHNASLRKRESARALCYSQIDMLFYKDLMQVAEAHPTLQRRVEASARIIGLHRSVVVISKVIKQLKFHGLVDGVTKALVGKVTEAALSGDVDGDAVANPDKRPRIEQLVEAAAEEAAEDEESMTENESEGATARSMKDMQGALLIASMKAEADELIAAYVTRLENLMGLNRRPPVGRKGANVRAQTYRFLGLDDFFMEPQLGDADSPEGIILPSPIFRRMRRTQTLI